MCPLLFNNCLTHVNIYWSIQVYNTWSDFRKARTMDATTTHAVHYILTCVKHGTTLTYQVTFLVLRAPPFLSCQGPRHDFFATEQVFGDAYSQSTNEYPDRPSGPGPGPLLLAVSCLSNSHLDGQEPCASWPILPTAVGRQVWQAPVSPTAHRTHHDIADIPRLPSFLLFTYNMPPLCKSQR